MGVAALASVALLVPRARVARARNLSIAFEPLADTLRAMQHHLVIALSE